MNRHRELAQMMRAAEVGGLGQNISRIQFTEGAGSTLTDTGDAGLGANGTVIGVVSTSWTTESGKDVLSFVSSTSDINSPGWHQLNQLDSYVVGADIKWSACFHMCVTRVPEYTIGMVMSKWSRNRCNDAPNFYIAFEADMQLRFILYSGVTPASGQYVLLTTDIPFVSVDTWFKLVVTYDGTQDGNAGLDRIKIYKDGIEVAVSKTNGAGAWPFDMDSGVASANALSFCAAMGSPDVFCRDYGLQAKWADYTLYDRVLSAADAAQYQGGF